MRQTLIFAAAAALVALVSCAREELMESPKNDSPVFTAFTSGATRTTVSMTDGKVAWEATDEIIVKDAKSATAVYKIESIDSETGKATFVIKDGEYTAGYGDNLNMVNGGVLHTEQAYAPSNNACCAPMMAKVSVSEGVASMADFKNICGALRLELKGNGVVKEIKVTTDQAQGGLIALDEDGAAYVRVYPGAKEVTLNCGETEVALTSEAKPFYISMPKNDYTGVKIEVTDLSGNTCTKVLKADRTLNIARAQITSASLTVMFSPTTGNSRRQEGIRCCHCSYTSSPPHS